MWNYTMGRQEIPRHTTIVNGIAYIGSAATNSLRLMR
jgi:hypothetical protein